MLTLSRYSCDPLSSAQPFVEKAMSRVPRTLTAGIKTFFCGPESFTPDLAPVLGEAPEVRRYFVAAGLNSIGILSGGGVGKLIADWVNVHENISVSAENENYSAFLSLVVVNVPRWSMASPTETWTLRVATSIACTPTRTHPHTEARELWRA